ncbi:response regulator [Dongia sp.]|uniref:response regulator n=1 Tax=Dongia sp. TaxID=1977262 RepID=UPI0037518BF1
MAMDSTSDSRNAAAAESKMITEGPWSVLIVDDDPSLRETLRRMIESVGYDVQCAPDARAAIDCVAGHEPDIIITDIYMPAGDGFELLNWLRNNGIRTPVIAMSGSNSGSGEYDQLAVAEHLGAAAVIDKPFRQSKLVETIDRVLANRGAPPR